MPSMPKTRKRKTPVTSVETSFSSSTPQSSRTLIRRFHVLLKRRAQLEKQKDSAESARELLEVDHEIAALGGLSAYQRMSSIGQGEDRGGGSEKILIAWLREFGEHERKQRGKLKLLEVGALKHDNYGVCSTWLDNHPIDLLSRHPMITEQDFLEMDQTEHASGWDAISLSLVVNFVPDPRDRGRMLQYAHRMLRDNGLLFLALPLPCVSNSRYMSADHLTELMKSVGFQKLRERWKDGGKMAYWLFRKGLVDTTVSQSFDKKVVLRDGNRNNFSILL